MPEQKIPGNYVSEKGANGKWTIKDVPIFAEVKDKESQLGQKITPDILKKLLTKAQSRAEEKYFPPLHVNHHQDEKQVTQVGFFVATKIGTIIYEEEETSVIFADLVDIPEGFYNMIKDGMFPYRSAEIIGLKSDDPEITSLALLEHDTPFFRLPLLTIGKEISGNTDTTMKGKQPARAFQTFADGLSRILFSLEGGDKKMADKVIPPVANDPTKETPPVKKFQEMNPEEKMAAIFDMLEKILNAVEGNSEEKDKEDEDKDKKDPDEQDPNGPVDKKDGKVNEKGDIFKLEGKITTLESDLAKFKRRDEQKTWVETAKVKLAKFNIDGLDVKLMKMAEKGKEAMEHYVIGIEENAKSDPDQTFEAFSHDAQLIKDDPSMKEFVNLSPEKFSAVMQAAKEYEVAKKNSPALDKAMFIREYIAGQSEFNQAK